MKTPQDLTSHSPKTTSRRDCEASRKHRFLCSRIKIEETRISRQVSIPSRVYFDLDWELVNRINQIKAKRGSLYLEPQQLADLRYYSLINSPLIGRCDALSLVFSSNYLPTNSQKTTTVVRSTINLSGKISQEIQQDLWQKDLQFSFQVVEAHYWLIGEILRQLPLKSNNYAGFIFWILWFLITIAVSLIVFLLPLSFLFKTIIILLVLYILRRFINPLLVRNLKQLIIQQLVSGWLSNKTNKRQLGFKLLSLLI